MCLLTGVVCGGHSGEWATTQFKEYNFGDRACLRSGKLSDHKPKNAAKVKQVTASSMSIYPPNQQARAIAYSKKHGHIAVCNNMGKVSIR